ncbi:MAG: LamG-like jellyroll fold domain-containing protein, partial [Saprospiraceae bacterium]
GSSWTTWGKASGSANGQSYDMPVLDKTTEFRRAIISGCDNNTVTSRAYTSVKRINVIEANGVIKGTIVSGLNEGVAGVRVDVTRLTAVSGGTTANGSGFDTTGPNGEYEISGLYYGPGSANFRVTPSRADHDFNPNNSTVNIDSGTDRIADFTDITVFTVKGNISQSYGATSCNLAGVKVDLKFNGAVINPNEENSITDEFGNYTLQIDNQGIYTIEPRFEGHTFSPNVQSLNIDDNLENIDFEDDTKVSLQGFVRAGCETFMGTSEVTLTDIDNCFTITGMTDGNGFYIINDIPARVYNGKITNFTPINGFDKLTVLGFFNQSKEVDLSMESQNQDFTYHRPPVIEVIGMAEPPCSGVDFPVLDQAETTTLMIKIWEEGGTCPVGVGTLSVNDQIGDKGAEPIVLDFENGTYEYELTAGKPNIIFPYLKNLNITAIDTFEREDEYVIDALVTGGRPREQNFSTQSPQLPFLILRDPPGDGSYSFLEENKTTETATRFYVSDGESSNKWGNVRIGSKFEVSVFGIGTETSFWGDVGGSYEVNSTNANSSETIVSVTNTEAFQTNDNDDIIGTEGDVFVGAALAFAYAISDEVLFDPVTCQVLFDKQLIIATKGLETEFLYTENHIRESVIPELEMLRDDGAATSAEQANYDNQILVWQQMLQRNDELKAAAIFDQRLTFGANSPKTRSTTTTTTEISTIEFGMEINEEITSELGFEIGGSGINGGLITNFKMESGDSETNTTINELTVGYHLADDDAGDEFTVAVKTDPVYKTPVFELEGGQSSCPAEEGTNARDAVQLSAVNPIAAGVPANGTANFTLKAGNISFTEETRDYMIRFKQVTNPDGAAITLGGSPYVTPQPLDDISFGSEPNVTVTVTRGVNSPVYTYEGLEFELYSECDPDISSTIALTAFFQSPCSDITLIEPQDGFIIDQSDDNDIVVRMNGYDVNNLDQVVLEYTKAGESNWKDGVVLGSGDLVDSQYGTEVIWDVVNVPDGNYNLRLKLACGLNSVYSTRIGGLLDRRAPNVLSTPEPTDDNYVLGDEISITFDENVNCSNISAANVTLERVFFDEIINAQVTCINNRLVITPNNPITSFSAEPFKIKLTGVQDIHGNQIPEAIYWDFNVGGALGTLDLDNDGVPNPLDKCSGYDDNQDMDNDGIPDGCDLCAETANVGLDLDGQDDYVELGSTLGNFGTDDFTMELWMKTDMVVPSSKNTPIISKRAACGFTNFWNLLLQPSGKLRWESINDNSGTVRNNVFGNTPINDDQWHHVAVVRKMDSLRLYIDGFLDVVLEVPTKIDFDNTAVTKIGTSACGDNGTAPLFDGQVDELRFWNTARTSGELSAYAERELSGKETDLLACFSMNEGVPAADNQSLSSIMDATSTGYAGTLQNFARNQSNSNWLIGAPIQPLDANKNGIGDNCDASVCDMSTGDTDGDLQPNNCDNCPDVANPGLVFDGVDDYVNLGDTLGDFGTNDFSIELWLKTDYSTMGSEGSVDIVAKRGECNFVTLWSLKYDMNGKPVMEIIDQPQSLQYDVSGTTSINDNIWHHLAFTRKGNISSMYVDGILEGTRDLPVADLDSDAELWIGKSACANFPWAAHFKGSMDELRLYDRALSQADILNNQNREISPASNGLIAYYPFNQGTPAANNASETILNDKTRNGYDGT